MNPTSLEELKQSNERWEQFAFAVSHDLRAPMRAIENLCQWIREELGPDPSPELSENLELLSGRAVRLGRLVEDLLEYSRIGTQDYPRQRVELGPLAQELWSALPPRPGLKLRVAGGLPSLVAPEFLLRRVLFHLLSNASKHHDKDQGWVALSARDFGAYLEIVVEDDGPGIDPSHHQKIFLPCQTLKPKDEVEGSGMGLALAQRILEREGGSLRLDSELGKGSRFFVSWPKGPDEGGKAP